jgi:tetratricopeptide (TPR) repeat protein
VLLAAAAYGNSLAGPFIFDDEPSIIENPTIRRLWPIGPVLNPPPHSLTVVGRPLANFTLAINYALGGLAVRGYHIFNLVVHILAGLTLYGIVRRTLSLPGMPESLSRSASSLALSVAALWAVHPLQTESVTYIVQRTEALVGLLYLWTLYATIRCATADTLKRQQAWGACAALACLCGMAVKEVMVSAPLIVALYDRVFLCRSLREVWQKRRWLYLGMGLTWVLLGVLVVQSAGRGNSAGFGYGMTSWEYLRTQFGWIAHYLWLTFWPHPLVLDYGNATATSAAEIVPYAVLVAALLGGTLLAFFRQPWIGFLGIWFFAILAPTSSVVPLFGQTAAEHRMYLPLAAIVTLIVVRGWLLCDRVSRATPAIRRWATVLSACAVVGLAGCTWRRNQDYQSELQIWNSVVAARPQNPRGFISRGIAWRTLGRLDEAQADLTTALALEPRQTMAWCNLGLVNEQRGDLEAALEDFTKAIELERSNAQAWYCRGLVKRNLGRREEAIADYSAAIENYPGYADACNNRGSAWQEAGELNRALADYTRAIELNPDNFLYHFNRGGLQLQAGRLEPALTDLDATIRLAPRYVPAWLMRAQVQVEARQPAVAIDDYDRAIAIQPTSSDAWYGRALCHYSLGNHLQARADLDECIRLGGRPDPKFVEALAAATSRD